MEYYEASQNSEVGLHEWTWNDVQNMYIFRHYEKNAPIFINILQKQIHTCTSTCVRTEKRKQTTKVCEQNYYPWKQVFGGRDLCLLTFSVLKTFSSCYAHIIL